MGEKVDMAERLTGRITKHFTWREARCKDGTDVPFTLRDNAREVARNMEVLREDLGGPAITPGSWYRTASHNRHRGAKRSQHLLAAAMDIRVAGHSAESVAHRIEELIHEGKMKAGGLHFYPRKLWRRAFVHYDVRGWNARW